MRYVVLKVIKCTYMVLKSKHVILLNLIKNILKKLGINVYSFEFRKIWHFLSSNMLISKYFAKDFYNKNRVTDIDFKINTIIVIQFT